MIYGREQELSYLERLYSKEGLQTCSVKGRRGVGKSSILNEFCIGKRAIDIQFVKDSRADNFDILNIQLSNLLGESLPSYDTLVRYFEEIARYCKEAKTVVVLDEFPYLQECCPEAASVIQRFLDVNVRDIDCMVILCGSVSSVMRYETESMSRPLYGRFENSLTVQPLDIRTCRSFHPEQSVQDQISVYLTVGGIPRFQRKMTYPTYPDCIMNNYVLESADMKDTGPEFIRTEIDDAKDHIAAVSCIANGSVRQKEIAEKLNIDPSYCKKLLDRLEDVKIIGRENPMFGAPKKPVYFIEDNPVAFHFNVVTRISPMLSGNVKDYRIISHRIDTFLGHRFELLCRDYVLGNYNVTEIGRWWGYSDSEYTDIDVVAKTIDDEGIVRNMFCECKFSSRPMGFGALNTLVSRVEGLRGVDNPVYALFSVNGFDDELREYANDNGIILVDGQTILDWTTAVRGTNVLI